MALKKKIKARAGFEMEYWKISDWHIKMAYRVMDITLTPYISSVTRESGMDPVNEEVRKIRVYDDVDKVNPEKSVLNYTNYFSPEALERSKLDIYKIMYQYIKDHVPEFEGAEDC